MVPAPAQATIPCRQVSCRRYSSWPLTTFYPGSALVVAAHPFIAAEQRHHAPRYSPWVKAPSASQASTLFSLRA